MGRGRWASPLTPNLNMGSWADLSLSASALKGIVPVDMVDRDFGTFDTDVIDTDTLNEVKAYIEIRVTEKDPLLADRADGPAEFMDAAIDINKAHVNSFIQRMLGYKYAQFFYESQAIGARGMYDLQAERFEHRFNEAFFAFMGYILHDKDFFTQLETTVDDDMDKFRGVRNWIG